MSKTNIIGGANIVGAAGTQAASPTTLTPKTTADATPGQKLAMGRALIAAEQLLTLQDVGQIFQIGRTSVWKLITEGGLRRVKFGKIVRVKKSDLQAWIEKHMTTEGGTK